jgi:hypothetical protein
MKSELVGPVRSVRGEWAEWDLTNEVWKAPQRVTIEEYRPDGKISSSELRFVGGSVSRSAYSYDEAGLLVETQIWNGDAPAGRWVNEYDADRLIRTVGHLPDGSEQVGEERTYAPDGSHERIMHLPETRFNTMVSLGAVEGLDFSVGAPYARTMITRYDREERACEVLVKDGMERAVRRLAMDRDTHGRTLKAELFSDEPLVPNVPAFGVDVPMMTATLAYDESGHLIQSVRSMFGLNEHRETYRYDDRGNRTETTSEEQTYEAQVLEDGTVERGEGKSERRQTRFTSKYDAQGNWVERVTSQRYQSNPDFTTVSIDRRQIVY